MIKDKKGFAFTIGAALFFIILIGGAVAIAAFLFSGTLRYTIIGIAVLVGFVYVVGQAMSSEFTTPKVVVLLVFLIVGVGFIFYAQVAQEQLGFTPRYCRDYEFTCCGETLDASDSKISISDENAWQCPNFATRCTIESIDSHVTIYIGSRNCKLDKGFLGERFKCDDETSSSRRELMPGEYIWTMNSLSKTANVHGTLNNVKTFEKRLGFCGKSGTVGQGISCGIKVSGADGCHYNPAGSYIFSETGNKIHVPEFYTVPLHDCILSWQGQRTICGNLEETCDRDSDCTGYEFGNQECTGRTLQTYGCVKFGKWDAPVERDRLAGIDSDFGQTDTSTIGGQRCDIVDADPVQCCHGGDCGPGLFCDIGDTWTCVEEQECRQDSDCGVETTCDWTTKEIVEPECRSGSCEEDRTKVDCCNDGNCPSGLFCDTNHKCKQSIIPKDECPHTCCIDEEKYYDRLCEAGFCIDNICQTEAECTKDSDCEEGEECKESVCKEIKEKDELVCTWYETEGVVSESLYKWYNYLGIGKPTIITTPICKTPGWVYASIAGIVVIILGGLIIVTIRPKKTKRKKKNVKKI